MSRKRVIILGIVLGLAGIQAVYPIDWKMFEPDSYIDNDSIQKYEDSSLGKNLYSYLLMDKKLGKSLYKDNFDYGILKYIVNCDTKQNATKAITIVDKNGNVLASTVYSNNEMDWQNITFGSKNEYFFNLCCNSNNKNTNNESNIATLIYDNAVKSAVYIETKDKTGTPLKSGSGTIVLEDGTLITCFHVIANADRIEVKLKDGSMYQVNGFRYINPLEDIAILTLDSTRKFTPIKINNSNDLKIGEKVYALANPKGLQFTFADGMLNQQKDGILQFSAPASQGSSGGALINNKGELIGTISSQYDPSESQNINFAISNKYYLSKINNYPIKNYDNIGWTDFIVSKADSKQLRMYVAHAAYINDFVAVYNYIKPFTKRADFPKDRYATVGMLATFSIVNAPNMEFINKAIEDALFMFNKSITAGYNLETSAFALAFLSFAPGNEDEYHTKLCIKGIEILKNKYPDSLKKYYEILYSMETCNGEEECLSQRMVDGLGYLGELCLKEMGEKYGDYEWFLKMEK